MEIAEKIEATRPTVGDEANYPTQFNTFFDHVKTWFTIIEDAIAGTHATLKNKTYIDAGDAAERSYTDAQVAILNGQIATGGADWSTFGDPLQLLRINAAGDNPEGIEWSSIGAEGMTLIINAAGDGLSGYDDIVENDFRSNF